MDGDKEWAYGYGFQDGELLMTATFGGGVSEYGYLWLDYKVDEFPRLICNSDAEKPSRRGFAEQSGWWSG